LAIPSAAVLLGPSLCGGVRLSHVRLSFRRLAAVKGDGARRRSSNGRALAYRSTIRPVVHPPSTIRSKRDPEPERWKFVAQVCRSMCVQRSRMSVRQHSTRPFIQLG